MKTTLSTTALAAVLLIGAGCHHNNQPATSSSATASQPTQTTSAQEASAAAAATPEQLGTLGAEIKKHPNQARQLILQHGMTEQSFAAAVRKVSENPADAKRYAAAYKQSI